MLFSRNGVREHHDRSRSNQNPKKRKEMKKGKKENVNSDQPGETGKDPHQSLFTVYSVRSRACLD